jgi:hypothetical protein
VKLSLKTKLVTVGVAVMLGLGGVGVWLWHSNETPQKHTTAQRDVNEKKASSALATSRVQTSRSTPKVAQKQLAKSSLSNQEKKTSDEEEEQFEKRLAEPKQSEQQSAEEADLSQSKQEETTSPALSAETQAKYQVLKGMFVQMKELTEKERTIHDELMRRVDAKEKEVDVNAYLDKMVALRKEWLAVYNEIDKIVPGALVTETREHVDEFGNRLTLYACGIDREYLESVLGSIPDDVKDYFPSGRRVFRIPLSGNE